MAIGRTFQRGVHEGAAEHRVRRAGLLRPAGAAGGPRGPDREGPRPHPRAAPGAAAGALPRLPRGDERRRGVPAHAPSTPGSSATSASSRWRRRRCPGRSWPTWTTPGSGGSRRTGSPTGCSRFLTRHDRGARCGRTGTGRASAPSTSGWTPAPPSSRPTRPTSTRPTRTRTRRPPTDRKKVLILGSGPIRIGQGIEFDYCCVHAVFALREAGYETVMVNCNPETVSTDYDTSDRLYFEPLTLEDVLEIAHREKPDRRHRPVRRPDAAAALGAAGEGRAAHPRDHAGRHRPRRGPRALRQADREARAEAAGERGGPRAPRRRYGIAAADRLPGDGAPLLRAGRPGDGGGLRRREPRAVHARGGERLARAPGAHRPLPQGRHRGGPRPGRGPDGRGAGGRRARAHRGGGHPLRRRVGDAAAALALPGPGGADEGPGHGAGSRARRRRADERAVRHPGEDRLRPGGEPAGVADGALHLQGHRRGAGEDRGAVHGGQDAPRS